jgi:inner membrane protein
VDNLTHSFAGALLAQMGLKKLSGRATSTLVIAANIPDIDAVASLLGRESLAIRRGLTHGPIALALLPLLLTGLVLLWNKWRPAEQPVRPLPLLLCAYIGALSHPALDWLNSYGIRLLEPFSSTWYAGDTLFIIDLWVWITLIGCWVWSRRREKRGGDWQRPAWLGFTAIGAYIAANGLITGQIERKAAEAFQWEYLTAPDLLVANPVPLTFWKRQVLWRGQGVHGTFPMSIVDRRLISARPDTDLGVVGPLNLDHPALAAARGGSDVEAFLFWSRMPIVIERDGQLFLADQRFNSELTRDQFLVPLSSRP